MDRVLWVTARYRRFRNGVRDYYRLHYPLTATAPANPRLNPGGGSVSRLCAEPAVYETTIRAMLAPHVASGRLRVLTRCRPIAASTQGDRVQSVTFRHRRSGGGVGGALPAAGHDTGSGLGVKSGDRGISGAAEDAGF